MNGEKTRTHFGRWEVLLCDYFRGGWLFFVPYLAFYLVYWWRDWPVNPVGGWAGAFCLLHVYWVLHGLHVVFALWAVAYRFGFVGESGVDESQFEKAQGYALLPWVLLAISFYIPGVYLEYPGDPWEHLSRINSWRFCDTVGDYFARTKSGYFFSYSLLGQLRAATELSCLDAYSTAGSLLLSWQYYLLAREVKLPRGPAMAFTILQAFLFGNNIFSFYRYYGLSSTLFAQIGAVAFLRVTFQWMQSQGSFQSSLESVSGWALRAGIAVALLAIMTLNHLQALGLAAVGTSGLIVWRLLEWRRGLAWWLALGGLMLSVAAVYWWPRSPAIDAVYRPEAWLTSWLGFAIFSPGTPAFSRMVEVLGALGLVNVVAGLWLLRRNHVVGWMTVMPVLSLALPFVAIPLANALARTSDAYILSFNRLLLGIPVSLALVVVVHAWWDRHRREPGRIAKHAGYLTLMTASVAGLTLPIGRFGYNRTWNALAVIPDDLQAGPVLAILDRHRRVAAESPVEAPPLLLSYDFGFTAFATGLRKIASPAGRTLTAMPAPSDRSGDFVARIEHMVSTRQPGILLIPAATGLYSPYSFAGWFSTHWGSNLVALEYAGAPEFAAEARMRRATRGWRGDADAFVVVPEKVAGAPPR